MKPPGSPWRKIFEQIQYNAVRINLVDTRQNGAVLNEDGNPIASQRAPSAVPVFGSRQLHRELHRRARRCRHGMLNLRLPTAIRTGRIHGSARMRSNPVDFKSDCALAWER